MSMTCQELMLHAETGDGARRRPERDDVAAAENLPDDTRWWAALQGVCGGTWGGCVYDVEAVIERLGSVQESI